MDNEKSVAIIGGGFAGVSAAQELAGVRGLQVTLIDRRNHHLFQPLLYQVAMAGLNPADIAVPLRRLFSGDSNIRVRLSEVHGVDPEKMTVELDGKWQEFDYILMACGSKHAYFGHSEWEHVAPGLKTIEQATEIRRRVLLAFELAEKETDPEEMRRLLTFVVVGAGPTGVELAGALSEMARMTLYRDYARADLKQTRVVLVEAGSRVLSAFPDSLSTQAQKDLEALGVEVILGKMAGDLSSRGLKVGDDFVPARTLIWAAGVQPSKLSATVPAEKARDGRIIVTPDLSLAQHPNFFVLGDQAAVAGGDGKMLPALAPVAMQQGKWVARTILNELKGKARGTFHYRDKGIMATIGRSRAVVSTGPFKFSGFLAWLTWVFVHVAFLIRFKNRFFVLLQWAFAYFRFGTGARLIVHKTWKFYADQDIPIASDKSK